MIEEGYNALSKQIGMVQEGMDILNRDLETDRERYREISTRMGNLEVKLGQLENIINELRGYIKNQDVRIGDKVMEVTIPVQEETEKLRETIDRKKTVILKEIKQPIWKFWHWFRKR